MAPAFEWPKNMLRTNKYDPITALSHALARCRTFHKYEFHRVWQNDHRQDFSGKSGWPHYDFSKRRLRTEQWPYAIF